MLWLARGVWVLLPITAGGAIEAAIDGWSIAPRTVAAILVLSTWTMVAVALLVPRPRSFTLLRIGAPAIAGATIAAMTSTDVLFAVVAGGHSIIAAVLTLSGPVALACTDGASYGDEQRHPLRLPPHFILLVVPATVVLLTASVAAGPLLLADGRWPAGAPVTIIGVLFAFVLVRSLANLERRFVVLVPAGIVVSDSLTLVDPVLLPREHVRSLRRAVDTTRGLPAARPGVLDLRLGTANALELVTDEAAPIPCRDGRRLTRTIVTERLLFAPLRPAALLAAWQERVSARDRAQPR